MNPEAELRLLMLRHGETEWNRQHRYLGNSDIPLNETGLLQAQLAAAALHEEPIERIFTSPLQRAAETARLVGKDHGLAPLTDERLREMDFGVFEGLTFEEAQSKYPHQFADWLEDYEKPPDLGEKLTSLYARTRLFLQELQADHFGKVVLVVSHGGPMRELIRQTLGLSIDRHWWFQIDHAAICEIRYYSQGAVIMRLNDTAHLKSA